MNEMILSQVDNKIYIRTDGKKRVVAVFDPACLGIEIKKKDETQSVDLRELLLAHGYEIKKCETTACTEELVLQ